MLGIVCALRREAPRAVTAVVIAVSGMGRANAARAADDLASRNKLAGLISLGYAGALSPDLAVGDIIVDTTEPHWRRVAQERGARLGHIATVDRVILTVAERHELAARAGALAVDMESAAVIEVARRHALPCAAVRAITDTAARDLVIDWNRCYATDGSVRISQLLFQAVRRPRAIAEIRQLWYASRIASRNLTHFLAELMGSEAELPVEAFRAG